MFNKVRTAAPFKGIFPVRKVTHGAAEIEALRRKLEVVEMELKLVLEGSGDQEEEEAPTEGGAERIEERSNQSGRAEGESVQSGQHSGRKRRRGEAFVFWKANKPGA